MCWMCQFATVLWLLSCPGDISVKKQKRKRHLEETESIADVMKEEPADWTTMKHHKKHKTHKRHSIKVER